MTNGWKDSVPTHPIDRQWGAPCGHPAYRDDGNEERGKGVGVESRAREGSGQGSGGGCVGGGRR